MAVALGGLISLPAWAEGWNRASVASLQPILSADQDLLLADIVETIIPATDTPGAKALGVHSFIQKMVADCYEKSVQQNFVSGLTTVAGLARQTGKSFGALEEIQRLNLLKQLEQATDADQKSFYRLVKSLTIQGYMTSEYVMTNITKYELVPGRYHGCVPVKTKALTEKK
ncbi:lactose 3-dehydrogenase subunit gamma LacC [Nibrella saemangeumensis]|uniref:Lactose 3-dehydrogenase subunit gamma LacC n=2 Tax=Nibrella saemangeumensis TaxID=1084526 RepID=A0ABP8NHV7_9BACT